MKHLRDQKVVIIGAGHNGLILATLLADSGCQVELLEARDHIGGAAENFRFNCGCVISRAANSLKLLDDSVVSLLHRHPSFQLGEFVHSPHVQTIIRTDMGDVSVRRLDKVALSRDLAKQTGANPEQIDNFLSDLQAASSRIVELWTNPYATRAQFREKLAEIDETFPRLFLDGSIQDTASFYFNSDLVSLALCDLCNIIADAPTAASSAFCLLYLAGGDSCFATSFAVPRLGMGYLAHLLADIALASGVNISTDSVVQKIHLAGDSVSHIELRDGRKVTGDLYVSGVGPATTNRWITPSCSPDPSVKLSAYETGGVKLSCLAPKELFLETFGPPEGWPGQVILVETRDALREAAQLASRGQPSGRPLVEVTFPFIGGGPLECDEHIPFSVYSLFFPYDWWMQSSEHQPAREAVSRIRRVIARWYPAFAEVFTVHDLLSPVLCETTYGMFHGDVDHGSFASANILEGRGYGRLPHGSTPFSNLYNCSSGIHPGGLISGRPAIVCAKTIFDRFGA